MKQSLLPSAGVVSLLLALAGFQLQAIAKEPTVDERFRDAARTTSESDLPVLNSPQSKLVRPNTNVEVLTRPTRAVSQTGPAYLGVTFSDDNRHAVVRAVAPGSPAEQAGLSPGDVVETLQGIAIDSPQDVVDIIAKMRPGTMLDIGVSRRVSIRAQAPLSVAPGATMRRVGYPPESEDDRSYVPATNSTHELIPAPANFQGNTYQAQPNRNTAAPRQSTSGYSQPRNMNQNSNQNSNQSDGNRGLLRGRRR